MKIDVKESDSGNVVFIRVDECLDMTAYTLFGEAAALAVSNPMFSAIVVDLGKTQQLFDSGRAMLLTLRERAGRLKNRIYLANARPEIKLKLTQGTFPTMFHIMHDTAVKLSRLS